MPESHKLIKPRKMCDNGFQWAAAHGKLRINNVHKEEEACLILSESFELLDETGQEITLEGGFEVEEAWINVGFWLLAHVYDTHTYVLLRTTAASCLRASFLTSTPLLMPWLPAPAPQQEQASEKDISRLWNPHPLSGSYCMNRVHETKFKKTLTPRPKP